MPFPIVLLVLPIFALVSCNIVQRLVTAADVTVDTDESQSTFDGAKVFAINETVYDSWYFDAISKDGTQTVSIEFWRWKVSLSPDPVTPSYAINWVAINVVDANRTLISSAPIAFSSSITSDGFGASGDWSGNGSDSHIAKATFNGSPDLSQYTVTLDMEGINGTLTLESFAPAHYPDGSPPGSKTSSFLAPSAFWTNATPGGIANCQFTVNGEAFEISEGFGYHDQMWGVGWGSEVRMQYTGHAVIGPYTLVWMRTGDFKGTGYNSVYLAQNGSMIVGRHWVTTQDDSAEFVSPFGFTKSPLNPEEVDASYPEGFYIKFNDGDLEYCFVTRGNNAVIDFGSSRDNYTQWSGEIRGGVVGGHTHYGVGLWDWSNNPM
jgi:hypothetical protein